jgi:hypothetical protein
MFRFAKYFVKQRASCDEDKSISSSQIKTTQTTDQTTSNPINTNDHYSAINIEKTREQMRAKIIKNMLTSEIREADHMLRYAERAIVVADEYPVHISYEKDEPTCNEILYVVHKLNELGYRVSNIRKRNVEDGPRGHKYMKSIIYMEVNI